MTVLIYELAVFTVPAEQRDRYVDTYKLAYKKRLTDGVYGAPQAQILKCIEEPNRVAVLIKWESVEARRRAADAFSTWACMGDAKRILHCLTADADP